VPEPQQLFTHLLLIAVFAWVSAGLLREYLVKREPVTAEQLHGAGSMAVIMRDALKPNLLQTIENTPVIVHAGPFGNIAHGANSLLADRIALKLADYVVTEAGFASDLGFQKFCDIVCRVGGFAPSAAVLVTTVRATKSHGGVPFAKLGNEDVDAVRRGADNLAAHVQIIRQYGLPCVTFLRAGVPEAVPWAILRASSMGVGARAWGEVTYIGVGRSSTVLVTDQRSTWSLRNNGLPEAGMPKDDSSTRNHVTHWLTALPRDVVRQQRSAAIELCIWMAVVDRVIDPAERELLQGARVKAFWARVRQGGPVTVSISTAGSRVSPNPAST